MTNRHIRLAAVLATLAATAAAAAPPAPQIDLVASPQPVVAVSIKHGALMARVGLGFDKALILTAPAADRAGLKAFPLLGKQKVSNKLIPGGEAVFRGNFYDVAVAPLPQLSVPTVWVDKAVDAGSEGFISIMALNAQRVVIDQPSAPPGGITYTLASADSDEVQHRARLGTVEIRVLLDMKTPNTIMNATAAAALEAEGLVRRGGNVGLWEPFPQVALPYETLTVAPGARFEGLPLIAPVARVTEDRAKAIDARAKAGTSGEADQDDAIVVTAKAKKPAKPWLIIGRDVLGKCSRIVLDKPAKQWLLTCNFGGAG